jgi:hypothetical protein
MMHGQRLADGSVLLVSDEAAVMSARVKAAGRTWPWPQPNVTCGDTRVGLAWPALYENKAGGTYRPGAAYLVVADRNGVAYGLRRWRWHIVKTAVRSGDAGAEVVPGLRAIVAECMSAGVTRFAAQHDNEARSRSYADQLFADLPAARLLSWSPQVEVQNAVIRLLARAESRNGVRLSESAKESTDERNDLGKPGPLEIAFALACFDIEVNKVNVRQEPQELRSLYPLPKGARVFGGTP